MNKKKLKFLLILALVTPVLFFFNTGFSNDSAWKTFQTIGFSFVFAASLVWSTTRLYFLILSGVLLIFMSVVFILGELSWAEIFGSSSFGLAVLILIIYLPQIIKKGYVEKL